MTALHVTTQSNQSSYKYDVSIIIPFYKRQAEVEKLLTSLNNMDVEEVQLETIVVEDGSRVENSDQLKSLCNNINLSFHYNKKNSGPGYCRNLGASISQGKFLWFIDSDTVADNPKLMKNLLQTSRETRGVIAAGGMNEVVNGIQHIMKPIILPALHILHHKIPADQAIRNNWNEVLPCLTTSNFFIKGEKFFEAGGFDAPLKMYEDNEFCLRLRERFDGGFYQSAHTMILHNMSPKGREGGHFDYFSDQLRYMRIKFETRNTLLYRYGRWRLAVMPILELISFIIFFWGLKMNRWHIARTDHASAKNRHPMLLLANDILIALKYSLLSVFTFFGLIKIPEAVRQPILK